MKPDRLVRGDVGSTTIPDHVVGAPLKHECRDGAPPRLSSIPDHVVGAPLKQPLLERRGTGRGAIPDHVVGAPLKHARQ